MKAFFEASTKLERKLAPLVREIGADLNKDSPVQTCDGLGR